jgi:SAM-dependent methyltransferase
MTDPDDISDIIKYYDSGIENQRIQSHQLEFLVTTKIFAEKLKKKSRILELGAGSGFYTEFLAKLGHEVVAVELSPILAKQNQDNLIQKNLQHQAKVIIADARDIKSIKQDGFDSILVMGPLYHLVKHQDRLQLIKDLRHLLSEEGSLYASFLTRIGLVSYMLYRHPEWLVGTREDAVSIWQRGQNKSHPRSGQFRGYFVKLTQINELAQAAGFTVEETFCQDPCIGGADEIFNRLPDTNKFAWAEFLFELCRDPDSLGSGRSVLSLWRKREPFSE